jgi:hypothetical protein
MDNHIARHKHPKLVHPMYAGVAQIVNSNVLVETAAVQRKICIQFMNTMRITKNCSVDALDMENLKKRPLLSSYSPLKTTKKLLKKGWNQQEDM